MPEAVRVVVADDHAIFREGVARLLERIPGVELVGEAESGEEAVERAIATAADVVLMDIRMPGAGGITATAELHRRRPESRVIVLTMYEDDETVFAAIRAGARGYLLKDASPSLMLEAIRAVAAGQALLSPSIASRVLSTLTEASAPARKRPAAGLIEPLTPREREILALLMEGLRNREIAGRLHISEKTVVNHVSAILGKLQVEDRSQAISRAFREGLLD